MNLLEEGVRIFSEERCRGCGIEGEGLLCAVCKGVIVESSRVRKIGFEEGMVSNPKEVYWSVRYLGERDGILGEMVEEYKYMSRRGMEKALAEIVDEAYFKKYLFGKRGKMGAILVPMPTARKHIRARGLDHVYSIAKEIERRDGRVKVWRLLSRRKDTVQVGANEEKRKAQAKEAVRANFLEIKKAKERILSAGESSEKTAVVVMDDVWTTGASLLFAGKMLKEAGVGGRDGVGWEELEALAITKNRAGKSPELFMGKF